MSEHDIDSQLKEILDLLRPVPERSSAARVRSRTRFDTDLEAFFPVGVPHRGALKSPDKTSDSKPAAFFARSKGWFYRPAYAYLAITLLLLVALFSAGAITVQAAGSALPGDALYPLKLDVEQARIAITANPARQAELHLDFAQNRLEELAALAALGQYDRVASLAGQVNQQVTLAVAAARRLSDRDPELALSLQGQAQRTLDQFRDNLDAVIIIAPPSIQPALRAALDQTLEGNPPVETPNANQKPGGNNNANANSNGQGNAGSGNNNGNRPGVIPGAAANSNSNFNPSATPFVNANGNVTGAPGTVINGNSNDNSNANPNSNKDKTKEKNNNGNKDKDKNNNGQDKDNNGQDKENNGRNQSDQP
jgi:hypothetical protein